MDRNGKKAWCKRANASLGCGTYSGDQMMRDALLGIVLGLSVLFAVQEADAPESPGYIHHNSGACISLPSGVAMCAYVPPRP